MSTAIEPEYTISVGRHGVTLQWQGQTFQIDDDNLEDGGWQHEPAPLYCESDHCEDHDDLDEVVENLKRWHDDESGHAGPFKFCDAEPCKGIATHLGTGHR